MKFSKLFAVTAFAVMITSVVSADQGSAATTSGQVRIVRSTDFGHAPSGSVVNFGDSVQTSGNGRIRLQLQDGSSISMAEATEIQLVDPTQIRANHGELRVIFKSNRAINTPSAIVVGSRSDVAIDISPNGSTNVICLEGSAEVRSADPSQTTAVTCDTGEIVVVKAGRPPREPQLVDDRTVLLWKNITDPDEAPAFTPFP